MWLLKGMFVGAGVFAIFSVFYLYRRFYSYIPDAPKGVVTTVDVRAILHSTVQSPLYWAAFWLTVATACILMRLLQKP